MSARIREILKFAFTGGVCFLIEYAALVLLKELAGLDVLIATPLAFLVSVIVNYMMCMVWVFDGAKNGSRSAQLGFALTSVMGLGLNWLIMWLLTSLWGQDAVLLTIVGFPLKIYMVNKVIATLLVMIWNYLTKRLVLKGKINQ